MAGPGLCRPTARASIACSRAGTSQRSSTPRRSPMAKSIQIDRRRHLADEPATGHNRWHPDVAPAVEADEGEEVVLEARDALDGYLNAKSTEADFANLPVGA